MLKRDKEKAKVSVERIPIIEIMEIFLGLFPNLVAEKFRREK